MRAVLIANGYIKNPSFIKEKIIETDLVICVDGGLKYAHTAKIMPDYIIGDFDSADKELIESYVSLGAEVLQFPKKKDLTDMEIAIELAEEKGIKELFIFGATGGRSDHATANIMNLYQALEKGMNAAIIDEKEEILITKDKIELHRPKGTIISLVPIGGTAFKVKTEGLSYPLDYEDLYLGHSRGVSNIFEEEKAKVSLEKGALLVFINIVK